MKTILFFCLFLLLGSNVFAQDAVLISEGNFVRGVIQGTNFSAVTIMDDEQRVTQYEAKNIQSFMWNGETFVSRPIVIKKKMEFRFFKVIELGAVNLLSYGEKATTPQQAAPQQRAKIRPSISIGTGTGGYGGGVGGGITFGGGGRRDDEQAVNTPKGKISYFIEKPGTGPMQELSLENTTGVKNILLQKLISDEDLAESIKATESFDAVKLAAYVKSYNAGHK